MPLPDGGVITREVLLGLLSQTIPTRLNIATRPGVKGTAYREAHINASRQALLSSTTQGTLVLLMDSDVVLDDPTALAQLLDFKESTGLKAACLKTKGAEQPSGHIVAACALVDADVWRRIPYASEPLRCQCAKLSDVCASEYLPTPGLAHEIK